MLNSRHTAAVIVRMMVDSDAAADTILVAHLLPVVSANLIEAQVGEEILSRVRTM